MARALALALHPIRPDAADWLRSGVVAACALALIFAGQALPTL